jgi:hypothetical protein
MAGSTLIFSSPKAFGVCDNSSELLFVCFNIVFGVDISQEGEINLAITP